MAAKMSGKDFALEISLNGIFLKETFSSFEGGRMVFPSRMGLKHTLECLTFPRTRRTKNRKLQQKAQVVTYI